MPGAGEGRIIGAGNVKIVMIAAMGDCQQQHTRRIPRSPAELQTNLREQFSITKKALY